MRVYLQSLGCRLNQSEIEELAVGLAGAGCVLVDAPAAADVCVLNTCAVTSEAERKTVHTARTLARANPNAPILLIGCYATLAEMDAEVAKRCASLPNVRWVIGNAEKLQAAGRVLRSMLEQMRALSVEGEQADGTLYVRRARTRVSIKVQEGCDNHCTYCLTRLLRGSARSRPMAEIVDQVRRWVDQGVQEVVLTGVNLGSYGRDQGMKDGLRALIQELLRHTEIRRLRLSSLEPWDIDRSFFDLWADERLCRHLHLPLQSGCDATLRLMGRPITTERFAQLVEAARAAVPDLALTTDVMVGFPGESETAFQESLQFVAAMAFARLHVFPYSPRPGTAAVAFPAQVPPQVRRERAEVMRQLGQQLEAEFRARFVGREMLVLWEQRDHLGRWRGLTDNYLRVITSLETDLHNRITRTRLSSLENGCLVGEAVLK